MCAVADKPKFSPDDLLALPDEKSYELIDGELVGRNMGALSSWVAGQVHNFLNQHCQANRLGWTFPADMGYQCFPDSPKTVRKPDVSFVRQDRLPGGQLPDGWITFAPDLAVEVIWPNDSAYEVDEKIEAYLKVGVRLVWVINPHTRTVDIHSPDGPRGRLREGDELSGEEVIPGFRCPVASIFPAPSLTAPESSGE
ncbi:MAG TPA: Uma2 family endonuclease [Isosphaeraceae bacterium]|nr:Uma2 family endonuclease [Isosphaeraceae bacterium]